MTPDITVLMDELPAIGDMLDVTEPAFDPVKGCGRLELQLQQAGGIKTVTLNNVAYVA